MNYREYSPEREEFIKHLRDAKSSANDLADKADISFLSKEDFEKIERIQEELNSLYRKMKQD